MGKYTSLARKLEEHNAQEKFVDKKLDNTHKHSILLDTASPPVPSSAEGATNLRTTNLTNLIGPMPLPPAVVEDSAVTCIHETTVDTCAVCSGYARWLIADEARVYRARVDPEAVRREFWQMVRGGA